MVRENYDKKEGHSKADPFFQVIVQVKEMLPESLIYFIISMKLASIHKIYGRT